MTEQDHDNLPKSKSQIKREMLALQELGEKLVKLKPEQLKKIPLDEDLLTAILQAQTIKSHGALRRQLQYIGRLMRSCDAEPIQAAFAALNYSIRK